MFTGQNTQQTQHRFRATQSRGLLLPIIGHETRPGIFWVLKRGFQPTQRTHRKER